MFPKTGIFRFSEYWEGKKVLFIKYTKVKHFREICSKKNPYFSDCGYVQIYGLNFVSNFQNYAILYFIQKKRYSPEIECTIIEKNRLETTTC